MWKKFCNILTWGMGPSEKLNTSLPHLQNGWIFGLKITPPLGTFPKIHPFWRRSASLILKEATHCGHSTIRGTPLPSAVGTQNFASINVTTSDIFNMTWNKMTKECSSGPSVGPQYALSNWALNLVTFPQVDIYRQLCSKFEEEKKWPWYRIDIYNVKSFWWS